MRSFLKWNVVAVAALAMALAATSVALADTFTFTFTGGGVTATGILIGTSEGGGVFDVTGGSIALIGAPVSGSGSLLPTFSTFPNPTTNVGPSDPNYPLSADGAAYETYDNVLTPGSNPQLDNNGLLFAIGNDGVAIWSDGPGNYELFEGYYAVDTHGTFTATDVPEPSVLSMVTLGLLS